MNIIPAHNFILNEDRFNPNPRRVLFVFDLCITMIAFRTIIHHYISLFPTEPFAITKRCKYSLASFTCYSHFFEYDFRLFFAFAFFIAIIILATRVAFVGIGEVK